MRSAPICLVDIAHIAGAVATGVHPSPVGIAHFVTTTTHKTLRGPRGGLILCDKAYAKAIDSMIFPGIQGGPLVHVIAAKAVALKSAMSPEFKAYQEQILANARRLSSSMEKRGYRIVSGGTDNHLFLVDLSEKGITGKDAEQGLEESGIMLNKNLIPFDKRGPNVTSGIRIGTPAVTTRGMKEAEMEIIAEMMDAVLQNPGDEEIAPGDEGKGQGPVHEIPLLFRAFTPMKASAPDWDPLFHGNSGDRGEAVHLRQEE